MLEADRTVVTLVNLSPFAERNVIVQAGGFGEHRFDTVTYDVLTSDYPGLQKQYAPPPITTEERTVAVDDNRLVVKLPPGTAITLDLGTSRYKNQPSYQQPFVI